LVNSLQIAILLLILFFINSSKKFISLLPDTNKMEVVKEFLMYSKVALLPDLFFEMKPRNVKLLRGNPEICKAAITDVGPGIHVIIMFFSI